MGYRYQFSFPFSQTTQQVAYEIDKAKRRFVTVGIPQDPEPEDVASLAEDLAVNLDLTDEDEQSISFNDATEITRFRLPGMDPTDPDSIVSQKTVHYFISSCVLGEVREVKRYLDKSKEKHILLFGKDEQGNTALGLAAMEQYPDMIALLIGQGAEVNSRNREGRTPLMEAALWGRAENARILLENGADKTIRDRRGRTASDLASPSDKNAEERRERAILYKEDVYDADRQRKAIMRLLRDEPEPSQIPLRSARSTDPDYHHFSFHKSPEALSIVLSEPSKSFTVPNQWKTIARLDRGPPFPPIDAMSGWGHQGEELVTISGRDWTEEVFRICQLIGHQLPETPNRDQGRAGNFLACHAEKQLIAYLLSKHAFLKDEIAEQPHEEDPDDQTLRKLYLARPPVSLRNATILVSTPMCDDCADFVARVEANFPFIIRCICIDFGEQAKAFIRQNFPCLSLPADWPANPLDLER